METLEQLTTRWNHFLTQIEQRYFESLTQADEACKSQLIESDYDYETVLKTWIGIKAQIETLIEKIETTWDNQVKYKFWELAVDSISNYRKGSELSDKLIQNLLRFERDLKGQLSTIFYNHVLETSTTNFNCSQCSAHLSIQTNVFRAQYITCPYCTTVNTFEPDAKFLLVGSTIIDQIIAYQLKDLYELLEQAEHELNSARSDQKNDHLWDNYQLHYFNYYERFFMERKKLKVEAEQRFEEDRNRKKLEFEHFESIHRLDGSKKKELRYGIN